MKDPREQRGGESEHDQKGRLEDSEMRATRNTAGVMVTSEYPAMMAGCRSEAPKLGTSPLPVFHAF